MCARWCTVCTCDDPLSWAVCSSPSLPWCSVPFLLPLPFSWPSPSLFSPWRAPPASPVPQGLFQGLQFLDLPLQPDLTLQPQIQIASPPWAVPQCPPNSLFPSPDLLLQVLSFTQNSRLELGSCLLLHPRSSRTSWAPQVCTSRPPFRPICSSATSMPTSSISGLSCSIASSWDPISIPCFPPSQSHQGCIAVDQGPDTGQPPAGMLSSLTSHPGPEHTEHSNRVAK